MKFLQKKKKKQFKKKKKDLNRVIEKPITTDKICYENNEIEFYSTQSWKNYLKRNKSIIVDLFQG